MNIKRFVAPTSREALAQARMTFGDGTLILSNRPTADGVEVVATAEETVASLEPLAVPLEPMPAPARGGRLQERASDDLASPARAPRERALPAPRLEPRMDGPAPDSMVEQDTEQLAMSTLSFQDYVRERMLRRRHEALHGESAPTPLQERSLERMVRRRDDVLHDDAPVVPLRERTPERLPAVSAPRRGQPPRPMHADLGAEQIVTSPSITPQRAAQAAAAAAAAMPTLAAGNGQQHLIKELQTVKDLIEERFNTLAWLGQTQQNPIQSNLMLKFIRAGYSPALARSVVEHLPAHLPAPQAVRWLMQVLERNLKTDAQALPLYEEGGIHALVGATGVGKTTTTAKLAARCAREYGAASVGLITLDTYRIGAHEQLRAYGQMLGVVAHLAHDRAALQDLLGLLSSKKMVLIDTTGVAPRDPRKRGLLDVLDFPGINRLLVLNASAHGDTMDDVLTNFKTTGSQQAILSKTDEAVKLGPALDALIRHQMVLRGVTSGQRVPEDWQSADARQLVAESMRASVKSAFDPKAVELNFFFSTSALNAGEGLADVA